jgi:hypothetical protein
MLVAMNETVCIKHFLVKWNAKLGFTEVDDLRDFEGRAAFHLPLTCLFCAVNILAVIKFKALMLP